ncbi:hypothetical protein [Pseudomonas sp. BTN1]|uniref:hypothetical protein n=1 Tax=Pseudomonas sp. BTN1 TaxID=1750647 RepID=UPI000A9960EE|nr:hypothetical protein [Pseudomonas sp. BTN1]
MGIHRFYHADRWQGLTEGQTIELDSRGLSRFGSIYWDAICTKPFDSLTDAEQREFLLEQTRSLPVFSEHRCSRFQSMFGALSIEDAKRFVDTILPRPERVPIYEVFASSFCTLDMNWLDYASDVDTSIQNRRNYWYAEISNHNPETGDRKLPLLEVLMQLPVRVGKLVAWA